MEPHIRPARPEDGPAVAAWTRHTFPWGDYVPEVFEQWLAAPDSLLLVAEAAAGVVGMARVGMVSATEAWAQGIRVRPDHRRRGIGSALAGRLWGWAADRGARVVRLVVEDWNRPAASLMADFGFRPVCRWVYAERGVGENYPVPEGNGGRRVAAAEGLRPAHSSEAEPAMLSWAGGPLERAARGLFPVEWRWRRLSLDDVAEAARRRSLLTGRPGWAIADVDEDTYLVSWLTTTEADAAAAIRALVDGAAAAGTERIEVIAPDVDWIRRQLRRRGCDVHEMTVFALPL
jgi:GNAT superfamily N-acetyltransferase